MAVPLKEKSDDELIKVAELGLTGQGALGELLRRTKESADNAVKSADSTVLLSRVILYFAIGIFILSALTSLFILWVR